MGFVAKQEQWLVYAPISSSRDAVTVMVESAKIVEILADTVGIPEHLYVDTMSEEEFIKAFVK